MPPLEEPGALDVALETCKEGAFRPGGCRADAREEGLQRLGRYGGLFGRHVLIIWSSILPDRKERLYSWFRGYTIGMAAVDRDGVIEHRSSELESHIVVGKSRFGFFSA